MAEGLNNTLNRIRDGLDFLEDNGQDEFDKVESCFSMLNDFYTLLGLLYNSDKLRNWKRADDPSYDRFTSKLKSFLEYQGNYLNSISPLLITDNDKISKKIFSAQEEINSLLEKKGSLLKAISPLLEKESELKEGKERFDDLVAKKKALEEIEQSLSDVNIDAFSKEIKEKEETKRALEEKYQPLLEEKKRLDEDMSELDESFNNLTEEVQKLKGAYGKELAELTESIPKLITNIKDKRLSREEKLKKYVVDLEREAEELREVESKVHEQIHKINEYADSALTTHEILKAHFGSNKEIGEQFTKSLPHAKERIEELNRNIANELKEYDASLRDIQNRIKEIISEFKPVTFGD